MAGYMKRTIPQNSSLHKYLAWMAEGLADSGVDMKLEISVPIVPTMENIKEYMFKRIMTAMYPHITSTTELDTVQMQKVYRQFDFIIAERYGVSRPWPCRETEENEAKHKGL